MTSTYYVGNANARTIKAADWTALGLTGADVTWNAGNGWSINQSGLTVDQVAWLATQPEFLTGQPDGPRPGGSSGGGTPAFDITQYVAKTELGALAASALASAGAFRNEAQDIVDDTIGSRMPGSRLGIVRRTSTFTTTNTTAGNGASGVIPGLSLAITGQGRPISLKLYLPTVYHSVANTYVGFSLNAGNPLAASNAQLGSVVSGLTNNGPSKTLFLDTDALTQDQVYTFQVNVWGAAAGTSSLIAAAYCPIVLEAVSR